MAERRGSRIDTILYIGRRRRMKPAPGSRRETGENASIHHHCAKEENG